MKYRKLGNSGFEVSAVGLGANNFGGRLDYQSSNEVISQLFDVGINLIDTSNSYGNTLSEEYIGKALEGRREQAVIATKVSSRMSEGPNQAGNSRKHIMEQVEQSLTRLRTDYIDLYQIHWWDPTTPVEETLRALNDLVTQGKIRYFGCSNFTAWQVCESVWTSKELGIQTFVSAQPHYSMLERNVEQELIPFCGKYGVGILPYFPLANGFLTGKYRKDSPSPAGSRLESDNKGLFNDDNYALLERLIKFSEDRNRTVLELAFAWLLYNKDISSVIAGATKPEQVVANAAAADWELTDEEYDEVTGYLS